jgi:hypothetical protein
MRQGKNTIVTSSVKQGGDHEVEWGVDNDHKVIREQ